MQERFDRILKGLLPEGEAVLLGVSGGVDSMCMAELFLNSSLRPRFALAHCNFHLRGEESDSDEALVREWSGSHGVMFIKKDFDTRGHAAARGISVEMAARELRYVWFAQVCREGNYAALAVAHNANDNAETMILNLLRGTGLKGMTGMRRCSNLPDSPTLLLRPLLDFTRKDIHEYALSRGLPWHEDSTNADSAYKRNCVRNEIFPLFERLNPSFLATLNEDAERFAQVQSVADEYVRTVSEEVVRLGAGRLPVIDHQLLTSKSNWEYALFRILEPFGFTSSTVADLVSLLKGGGTVSGRKFVSGDHLAVTSAREIRVLRDSRAVARQARQSAEDAGITIEGPGAYSLNGVRLSVSLSDDVRNVWTVLGETKFDTSKIPFPFVVRHWRPGDWMRPLGMRGRKKLSDMFVDLKLDVLEKEKALVIADEGSHILALLGHRIDDAVKVTEATASVTIIRLI